jgi:phosphatidate cytidylyltransferase
MTDRVVRTITATALALGGVTLFKLLSPGGFVTLLVVLLVYILAIEWPRFNLWWLTPWYPVLPLLALMHLYLIQPVLWACLICVVAAYDTGAYFFGSWLGTTKIVPAISPGKTAEGLVGGFLSAGFMTLVCYYFLQKSLYFGILTLYLIGCSIGIIAFLGDLFESYLKRKAGLKDSGSLLPGHGGILDRIDGLLAAALIIEIIVYIRVII